ncbi:FAD-binding protein [Rhodococcus sp. BP-252]|uniref:FAD-linked oxidase n=1 Tax=Rhodococcoides kyotonense TaxID=398843 RepID=A0A177YKU4_9NOCA|nr:MULTISPECIES: cholesterol oxidase substrate-binding domain-containing protein [Rhodococcus]MBY6413198.1 FAD-binding protein [Rhodococcus sp. BP-320]MBY6418677.1 FAD-binding protein [Rhodococcus sp. BP-321]MBY6422971.1 FAD-binding protein [Rhodococcus sp. BP-324]MBY6427941.1 FAD-binding protein [Rhodococcus sp. BP-323]MBY6433119.1 FAD-binding protein [Rhodococcus sp. BP-322]
MPELTRRQFIAAGAGAVALTSVMRAVPVDAAPFGSSDATLPAPPNFPPGIPLYQQRYQNWSKEIVRDAVWTCSPTTPDDVVTLANWAHAHGYRIRPRGAMHGWTPLTIVNGENLDRIVLVDTTVHLNGVAVDPSASTVTAGAGATIEAMLQQLEDNGLGWVSVPAPGVLTVAGALAVDAHGAAVPADGETPTPGTTYGSLSNLVTSLTAVVWDGTAYALRTFDRSDPEITPLLTHLGRAFLTSVTMQAGANTRLRCQSYTDIPWRGMFSAPAASGRTFESYLNRTGRVEAIWYPFTENPWLKVWSVSPTKPPESREVNGPYNYPFSDNLPEAASDLIGQLTAGNTFIAPAFGQVYYGTTVAGLAATGSSDLWGWAKDLQFYIKPSTLLLTEGGGAVITSRGRVAQVVHDFAEWFHERVTYYQSIGQYPINGPVEIRCCGMDDPADVVVDSAGPPTISAMRPRPDHPEWDTAVWLNVLGVPGTPGMFAFYREMEQWMRSYYTGWATFRPEWSKGWAFGAELPYQDRTVIGTTLPNTYREGVPASENWDTARATFDSLDPHRIYSNTFIDQLLP